MYGRKHSEETKAKFIEYRTGRKHLDSTKQKMRDAHRDAQNSGRFKKGQKKIEGSGRPSQVLEVFDNKTNQTTVYESISEAARALCVKKEALLGYLKGTQKKTL